MERTEMTSLRTGMLMYHWKKKQYVMMNGTYST
ncbi:hypothetical protein HNR27_002854 [Ornithinibacillus bavariensis]